jgi:type I restriction enzyme R subunit
MDKKKLSERDICTKYVTPALSKAGWDVDAQIREEVRLTKGRVIVRGKLVARGKEKRADYVLYYKPNIPIAVIEAKDNSHGVSDGMQQALAYAEMLGVPFAYSTNGDGFWEHNQSGSSTTIERGLALAGFPSPEMLWKKYCQWKGIDQKAESTVLQDYHVGIDAKEPRYYQLNAINRTIEAIAKGQDRILLVMATGTGKTFTAFQIIWRLWKARKKKRILYLADRNILIDQTIVNDFKPFGSVMAKLTPKNKTIEKEDTKTEITSAMGGSERKVNKSYEIYLGLYQAIVGREGQEPVYKQFSPDFFDLIVVDECHRGSAAEDSAWREILDYFSSATQIGMTATPKETEYVSNIEYFGPAVYTYSLKQGIEDGFLAPYKVVRIDFDKDLSGWRPEKGKRDKFGQEIMDRIYNQTDFDRTLIIDNRTQLVAYKISEFLKNTNRYDKTIVFCEDIDHAERMRHALVNENADLVLEDPRYIMRITGDNDEGKAQLDNFIDPESTYPVIATTSRLMSTGVDSQTCRLIVLDRRIQSMTEFKQIIGRGTRIHEDYGKLYFTIMDFKKATELFADPDFDGEPVQIYKPGPSDTPVPPDEPSTTDTGPGGGDIGPGGEPTDGGDEGGEKRRKYYIDDVEVRVAAERVQYYDKDGKLITESLKDYTRKAIRKEYRSLDDFLRRWDKAEKKTAIIEELREQGLLLEALEDDVGKGYSAFDLICHVAFDQPPLTRRERAENVRKRNYFTKYGDKAKAVLDTLLEKYADGGLENLEDPAVLRVNPFDSLGTPVELIKAFGGPEKYHNAIHELEQALYQKKQS